MTVSSFVGVHDNIEFWRSTATTRQWWRNTRRDSPSMKYGAGSPDAPDERSSSRCSEGRNGRTTMALSRPKRKFL